MKILRLFKRAIYPNKSILMKKYIDELNEILWAEDFDIKILNDILHKIKREFQVSFEIIDFKIYNLDCLVKAIVDKKTAIGNKNFELAAQSRDLEKKCIKYLEIKNRFKIYTSEFQIDSDRILFFHTGTSPNDKAIKTELNKWTNII